MDAFAKGSVDSFKSDMVRHLQTHFPWQTGNWGRNTTEAVVDYGYSKALQYGLSTHQGACVYLTLMPMLGGCFDQDPLLPWAARVLTDKIITEPSVRANQLADEAMNYLERVFGEDNRALKRAVLTLRKEMKPIVASVPPSGFRAYAVSALRHLFPAKFEVHGESGISALVEDAMHRAQALQITDPKAQLLCAIVMCFLGSGLEKDPQLPMFQPIWKSTEPTGRTEKLEAICRDLIESWAGDEEQPSV